jgi:hypothetical protein
MQIGAFAKSNASVLNLVSLCQLYRYVYKVLIGIQLVFLSLIAFYKQCGEVVIKESRDNPLSSCSEVSPQPPKSLLVESV